MKSLHQRLQSRLSKRRNLIRDLEIDVAMMRAKRRIIHDLDLTDFINKDELNEDINTGRQFLRELADDQRLDKQLKNMVIGNDRIVRIWAA